MLEPEVRGQGNGADTVWRLAERVFLWEALPLAAFQTAQTMHCECYQGTSVYLHPPDEHLCKLNQDYVVTEKMFEVCHQLVL